VGTPKLFAPVVDVVMSDNTEHRVQCCNADMLNWDRTRFARKWPPTEECSTLWVTFLAWSAMKRQGLTAVSFNEFETACLSVEPVQIGGKDMVDPTNAEAEADS
jgi:hypothetical protein